MRGKIQLKKINGTMLEAREKKKEAGKRA